MNVVIDESAIHRNLNLVINKCLTRKDVADY